MKANKFFAALLVFVMQLTTAALAETSDYTATAQGFGGLVEVTLSMTDETITNAVIVADSETPAIGGAALSTLQEQILAANSAEIDGVTGATVTSNAVKEAAAKAIDASKGMVVIAAVLTDGVYTATRESYQHEHITVSVTITDGKIADVVIDEITDHPSTITDAPCAQIPAAIVENQSYNVDTVTGATFTSNSIKNAVRDCLEQAGSADAFSTPVEKPEIVVGEDIQTDILVIGAGAAGMTAALEASNSDELGTPSGLHVTLIEKAGFVGGSTSVSGGGFIKYLDETGAYDEAWIRSCIEADLEVIKNDLQTPFNSDLHYGEFAVMKRTNDLLEYNGVANFLDGYVSYFIPPENGQDKKWAGSYYAKYFNSFIGDRDIDLRVNTAATALLTNENGEVIGASVQDKTSTYNIYAKKVILACGGFANNKDMIAKYAPAYTNSLVFCAGTNTGDGFEMAVDLGAGIVGTEMFVELGVDDIVGIRPDWCMAYLWGGAKYMLVNPDGERFCNEYQTGYEVATEIAHHEERALAWAIVDAANAEMNGVGSAYDFEHGYLYSADSLEELAAMIDVPADTLIATAKAYNAAAAGETEDAFGGNADTMDSLDDGPYYALKMRPCMITSLVALTVDSNCHVLNTNGEEIPNLFATGDLILGNLLKIYNSGHGVGNAVYSGDMAAQTAKAEIAD